MVNPFKAKVKDINLPQYNATDFANQIVILYPYYSEVFQETWYFVGSPKRDSDYKQKWLYRKDFTIIIDKLGLLLYGPDKA